MQRSRLLCAVLGKRSVGKSTLIENISHSNRRHERDSKGVPTVGVTFLPQKGPPAHFFEMKDFECDKNAPITEEPIPDNFTHAVILGDAAIGNIWDEWRDMKATARRLKHTNPNLFVTAIFMKKDLLCYNKRNIQPLKKLIPSISVPKDSSSPRVVGFNIDIYGGSYGYSKEYKSGIIEHIFSDRL